MISGDGCSSTCIVEYGFYCSGNSSVCSSVCGDNKKASNEGCDDGNLNSGDGCSGTCTVEFGYLCVGSPSICSSTCGDGQKASDE